MLLNVLKGSLPHLVATNPKISLRTPQGLLKIFSARHRATGIT